MVDLDQETWIYLAIIAVFLLYFMWNSRRAKQNRRARKNRSFRKRYLERRRGEKSSTKDNSRNN